MKSFGPLSPEAFRALVDAPCGKAAETIKKYDPLYGSGQDGANTKFKFFVTFSRHARETGLATIEAASEHEARELARNLKERQIGWEVDYNYESFDFEVEDVSVGKK